MSTIKTAQTQLDNLAAAINAQNWQAAINASCALVDIRRNAKGLTRQGWETLEGIAKEQTTLMRSVPTEEWAKQ